MIDPIKIAVVTGSRAEYGLLKPLIKAIKTSKQFALQLIATGMHLSPEFGLTYKSIEGDGFVLDEKVDMLLSGDSSVAVSKSTGLGIIGMADAYARLMPDWVILLGDRFEILSAAYAAYQAKIPIAHLHGGELTEGATDDAIRHAISKMSYIHFTSTEIYRKRVIQLGEHPSKVFNVGAIGVESILKYKPMSASKLEESLSVRFGELNFLVTYHPVTLESMSVDFQLEQLFKALDKFSNAKIFITMPNADAGGRAIMRKMELYGKSNSDRVYLFASLGNERYVSLLHKVDVVIGNSSSGLIEAPSIMVPTVNIGSRQDGRVKGASVIDTKVNAKNIREAIELALSDKFKSKIKGSKNPYQGNNTTQRILSIINKFGRINSIRKQFYDIS